MASRSEDRCEIAFFDLETTMPTRTDQDLTILEFGSILVCPKKLVELDNYSTLVRPADPSVINSLPDRRNGITRAALIDAPFFQDIADKVYDILHGRIWAGHNILQFDCVLIRQAFAQIGRPAPEPKDTIDSLEFLKQQFGTKAGNMKMASLATYFGLGQQTHRSLDDVRMNLEVLKCCAAVLFLESSLPNIFKKNSWEFLQPDEVSIPSIRPTLLMLDNGSLRIKLLHKDETLQLCCRHMELLFGINEEYFDLTGRLDIVCFASQNLCEVLDACDGVAQKLSMDSGSSSEWQPAVIRREGFYTVRLHIQHATEIYQKEPSGAEQRLFFTEFDASELSTLFKPRTFIDAFFSLEPYDCQYQQMAGIKSVAKKLILLSN
ncbi:hypothetical protein ACFX2I_015551 [Malus domestica]|nr:protein NEN3-like [Malus domestica]